MLINWHTTPLCQIQICRQWEFLIGEICLKKDPVETKGLASLVSRVAQLRFTLFLTDPEVVRINDHIAAEFEVGDSGFFQKLFEILLRHPEQLRPDSTAELSRLRKGSRWLREVVYEVESEPIRFNVLVWFRHEIKAWHFLSRHIPDNDIVDGAYLSRSEWQARKAKEWVKARMLRSNTHLRDHAIKLATPTAVAPRLPPGRNGSVDLPLSDNENIVPAIPVQSNIQCWFFEELYQAD